MVINMNESFSLNGKDKKSGNESSLVLGGILVFNSGDQSLDLFLHGWGREFSLKDNSAQGHTLDL